nr:hypothetical protein [Ferrovum sp.]
MEHINVIASIPILVIMIRMLTLIISRKSTLAKFLYKAPAISFFMVMLASMVECAGLEQLSASSLVAYYIYTQTTLLTIYVTIKEKNDHHH